MIKIAICTICKNEERHLERFFKKHLDADYICLLDTGSTDRTLEIIQEYQSLYPQKIIYKQDIFNPFRFDLARNKAFTLVPPDTTLILKVDIDEYLSDNWYQQIQELYDGSDTLNLNYQEIVNNKVIKNVTSFIGIKNGYPWYWKFPVHENLFCDQETNIQNLLGITVFHTPKSDIIENEQKVKFYDSLLEIRYKENPDDLDTLFYIVYSEFQKDSSDIRILASILGRLYTEFFSQIKFRSQYIILFIITVYFFNRDFFENLEERNKLKSFLKKLHLEAVSKEDAQKISEIFSDYETLKFIPELKEYYSNGNLSYSLEFFKSLIKENSYFSFRDLHDIKAVFEQLRNITQEFIDNLDFEDSSSLFFNEKKILYKQAYKHIDKLALIFRTLETTTPLKYLGIEVLLTDHCNLNCAYCNHFSPLADPGFYSIDQYEKDCQRLSHLFSNRINNIKLMGGEPTLHPDLIEFCKISRKYFSSFEDTRISILTNGCNLLTLPEELFQVCRDNHIKISITPYENLNIEKLMNFVEQKGVQIDLYPDNFNTDKKAIMEKFCVNPEGTTDVKYRFMDCGNANKTLSLRDGYLYTCPFKATVKFFSQKFNYSLPVDPQINGANIHQLNYLEIVKFLACPTELCKYCYGECSFKPWAISTRKKEEWLLDSEDKPRYPNATVTKICKNKDNI